MTYLEEVRTGKNLIVPVTMFKYKRAGTRDVASGLDRNPLSESSETLPGSSITVLDFRLPFGQNCLAPRAVPVFRCQQKLRRQIVHR